MLWGVASKFFIPVIVSLAGFYSYTALFVDEAMPRSWLALARLFVILALTRNLILELYPGALTWHVRQCRPGTRIDRGLSGLHQIHTKLPRHVQGCC